MKKNYIYRSPKSWHRAPKTLRIWIPIWKKKNFIGQSGSSEQELSVLLGVIIVVVVHSVVSDSLTPWTISQQAPLSMGIFQARLLEWVAISFSRVSSWPRWSWHLVLFFSSSLRVLLEMACWNCLLIKLRWGLQSTLYHLPKKKKTNQPTIKINISIYPSKSSLESLALEKLKSNVKG